VIIYQVKVVQAGSLIFSHDIALVKGSSFDEDVLAAFSTFHSNFPTVDLSDETVSLSIIRKAD